VKVAVSHTFAVIPKEWCGDFYH